MGIVSEKLRASARGQRCMFAIPTICNHDPETTVLCHAPSEVKGMGSKGHDYHGAFGCSECHKILDLHELPLSLARFYWLRGMMRTQDYWVEHGQIVIAGDNEKPRKPSHKIMQRTSLFRSTP